MLTTRVVHRSKGLLLSQRRAFSQLPLGPRCPLAHGGQLMICWDNGEAMPPMHTQIGDRSSASMKIKHLNYRTPALRRRLSE